MVARRNFLFSLKILSLSCLVGLASQASRFSASSWAQDPPEEAEHHEMDQVNALIGITNTRIAAFMEAEANRDRVAACDAYGPAVAAMGAVRDKSYELMRAITDAPSYAEMLRDSGDEADAAVKDLTARKDRTCTVEALAGARTQKAVDDWARVLGLAPGGATSALIQVAQMSLTSESANWNAADQLMAGKKPKYDLACMQYFRASRDILSAQWALATYLKVEPDSSSASTVQDILGRMPVRIKQLETAANKACKSSTDMMLLDYMLTPNRDVKKSKLAKGPEPIRSAYSTGTTGNGWEFHARDLEEQGLFALSCKEYKGAADKFQSGAEQMLIADGIDVQGFAAMRYDLVRRADDARKSADEVCSRDEVGERLDRIIAVLNSLSGDMQPGVDRAIELLASDHADWACEVLTDMRGQIERGQRNVASIEESDKSHAKFAEAYSAATRFVDLASNASTLKQVACK